MSSIQASQGFGGHLDVTHIVGDRPRIHKAKSLRTPFGRLIFTRDKGESKILSSAQFITNTTLVHRDGDGKLIKEMDLGSGFVTNAGVNLMSNDFNWTNATLKNANYHAIGTGTTAAASSDVWLQTGNGQTNVSGTTSTDGYMTGTQNVIANATGTPWSPVYQTQATFTFTGAVAVTEWILAVSNSPVAVKIAGTATATSSTSLTGTATPFSASPAQVMWTVEALASGAIPINTTPTTTPMLQVQANTTSVLTGLDNIWSSGVKSWLALNNQAVSTPSGTTLFVVFPTAWDHKVFSVVNTANGDTIQFTYQLSINSGG